MEKLRRVREERGYTQRQLADRAGVVKSTIYEAEVGRHRPRLDTLDKLAAALGVSVTDLLDGKPPAAGPTG